MEDDAHREPDDLPARSDDDAPEQPTVRPDPGTPAIQPGTSPGRPDPAERTKLAIAAVTDVCKQLLTLTTAIVTITITFTKDIAKQATPLDQRWLKAAWVAYAISVLAGTATLLAVTGTLAATRLKLDDDQQLVYRTNIRRPAALQVVSFAVGVSLIIVFGFFAYS